MTDNATIHARRLDAVPTGWASMLPTYIERASNAELWDADGKRYIDFAAGIAVVNTGHVHPRVRAAVIEQLDKVTHTCFMVTPYAPAVELAERINGLAPGDTPKKTMFVNSGAEAVENAVKIARYATGRDAVIAFSGGFHGRTMYTLALTGKVAPYKQGFGPMPADVYHAPYPHEYRGVSVDDSFAAIEHLFKEDVSPDRVAAIIAEPILGEGGFVPGPPEFFQRLRALCDEHGICLIIDEIQTGFGRTGTMFAIEQSGIEPDIMTLAKGIAGGFPLAAVTGRQELMDAPHPGGLGGTYGGSPISCAAGLAVLDVIDDEGLLEAATALGATIRAKLAEIARHVDYIGEIRGSGAMVGVELVRDSESKIPAPDLAKAIVAACAERGLLLLTCGVHGNVIRFLPALTAEHDIVGEGLSILADVMIHIDESVPA